MLLREALEKGVEEGGVLVVLSEVEGSVPRGAGTWMMVWEEGIEGSIGGGELEYWAIEKARCFEGVYASEEKILGPELGQCCGGRVRLLWQRVERGASWWREGRFVKLGRGGPWVLDEEEDLCLSLEDRRHELVIFGGGHVGKMVAKKSEGLDWRVTVVDSREEVVRLCEEEGLPCVYEEDLASYVRREIRGGYVLVMTHSHEQDYEVLREVLGVEGMEYVGLIGSETKAARFRSRLRGEGLGGKSWRYFQSPVGLEEMRGKDWNAAEVAISVWAELLMRSRM